MRMAHVNHEPERRAIRRHVCKREVESVELRRLRSARVTEPPILADHVSAGGCRCSWTWPALMPACYPHGDKMHKLVIATYAFATLLLAGCGSDSSTAPSSASIAGT